MTNRSRSHRLGICNCLPCRSLRRRGRVAALEALEPRLLLAAEWRNPLVSLDVTRDGLVTPQDVLIGINQLNANRGGPLTQPRGAGEPYYDVDGDGALTPADVLAAINAINQGFELPLRFQEEAAFARERIVTIGTQQEAGSRRYRFQVDASFDAADGQPVLRDTLAVYLTAEGDRGRTLLDRGTPGTTLFTLGEDGFEAASGLVEFDGSIVTLDLTDVSSASADLVFQLLSADADTGTRITVTPLANEVDPEGTAGLTFPADVPLAPGSSTNLAGLTAWDAVDLELANVRFGGTPGTLSAELRLLNEGPAMGRSAVVVFPDLPEGVRLRNASGLTESGAPYANLTPALRSGGLTTFQRSEAVLLEFEDPGLVRFPLTPVVLAGPNQPPVLQPVGPFTLSPGEVASASLSATDADGDPITFALDAPAGLPAGSLRGDNMLEFRPGSDDVGTYQFEIVASDGAAESRQPVTVNVLAPVVGTTRIQGHVVTLAGDSLAGVPVSLSGVQVDTATDGTFALDFGSALPEESVLTIFGDQLVGEPYPRVHIALDLLLGHPVWPSLPNSLAEPIVLTPLDAAHAVTITPDAAVTATNPNIPGLALTIDAGNLRIGDQPFARALTLTNVRLDSPPVPLPPGVSPDHIVALQPAGLTFATPAPIMFANTAGLVAGELLDLFVLSAAGEWEDVGDLRVSDDGTQYVLASGGVPTTGLLATALQPAALAFDDPDDDPLNPHFGQPAATVERYGTSTFDMQTGGLTESHSTVSYQSLGENRSVTLVYDSLRADPRQIVHFGVRGMTPRGTDNKRVLAQLEVKRGDFRYEVPSFTDSIPDNANIFIEPNTHVWSLPPLATEVQVGLIADLTYQPSGIYDYELMHGVKSLVRNNPTPVFQGSGFFVGQALTSEPGSFVHVNGIHSEFGAGWGVAGVQTIVEEPIRTEWVTSGRRKVLQKVGGEVLIIDGDGTELVFTQELTEVGQPDHNPPRYKSPPGDFSKLEKLGSGHFRRTTKDQTVYEFQGSRLVSMTDRNGNTTRYEYDPSGRLSRIVDPVNLATTFTYGTIPGANTVTITDPANRSTTLELRGGTLSKVTDPDGTSRQWSYDSRRLMTTELDKRGNTERAFYGFHGRGERAVRKDGGEVKVFSAQTIGLHPAEATSNIVNAPRAGQRHEAYAQFVDATGAVETINLDQMGQQTGGQDALGRLATFQRNQQNLVQAMKDGLVRTTEFTYDDRGNITTVADPLARKKSALPIFEPMVLSVPDMSSDVPVTADFDGDGRIDLAVRSGVEVDMFFFRPGNVEQQRLTEVAPFELAAGDMNGDGRPDLVSATNIVRTSINNGDGSFTQLPWVQMSGFYANDVDLTDMDNDGDLDVVAAVPADGEGGAIIVVPNRGDGTFGTPEVIETDIHLNYLRVFDLNRDHRFDLIASNTSGEAVVLYRTDTGTFAPTYFQVPGEFVFAGDMAIGDVNADGRFDLVLGEFVCLANTLAPSGFDCTRIPNPSSRFATITQAVLGDIDGDGDLDLVGNKGLALNDGTGQFTRSTVLPFAASAVTLADVSNDGIDDFVFTVSGVGLAIVEGRSSSPFIHFQKIDQGEFTSGVSSMSLVPFVGGAGQTIVTTSDNGYTIQSLQPDGSFGPTLRNVTNFGFGPGKFEIADVNLDFTNDILIARRDGSPQIWFGQGDGTVDPNPQDLVSTTFVIGYATDIALSDRGFVVSDASPAHNGDGLIRYTRTNDRDLAGRFLWTAEPFGGRLSVKRFVPYGHGFLVSACNPDEFPNPNTCTWTEPRSFQNAAVEKIYFMSDNFVGSDVPQLLFDDNGDLLEVADLNGDGHLDLLTTLRYDGEAGPFGGPDKLRIRYGTGFLTFGPVLEYVLPKGARDVAIGDLQGDGILDLVTANSGDPYRDPGSTLSVLFGTAGGVFVPPQSVFVNEAPGEVELVDVNHDGKLDIVTLHSPSFAACFSNSCQQGVSIRINKYVPADLNAIGLFQIQYDARFSQITKIVDELNHETLFEIDPNNGNVLSVTRVVGATGGGDDVVSRKTYTAQGLVASDTDPLGRVTRYEYDGLGRLVRTILAFGTPDQAETRNEYDAAGNVTAMTDERGHRTEHSYDSMNRLTQVKDALGNLTRFEYDANGNRTKATDARSFATTFAYDARDRLIRETDPLGNATAHTYNHEGDRLTTADPLGRTTRYAYDRRHRLVATTDPAGNITRRKYNNENVLIEVTDPLGRVTQYAPDARNRLARRIDPLGNATEFAYDMADRLVSSTDPLGRVTRYAYDDLDRRIVTTDPLGQGETTVYDAAGNVVRVTDKLGFSTTMTYDARNRLIAQTNALGGVVTFAYDAASNRTHTTNELGRSTNYAYDALDRTTTVTDALWQITTYAYDAVGNRVSTTDALGRTMRDEFDPRNLLEKQTDALGFVVTNTYDAVGQIVRRRDELGNDWGYEYDVRGLRTAEIDPLGQQITTTYDAVGSAIAETDKRGNVTRHEYDAVRRKVRTTDANGFSSTQQYDAVGNRLAITDRLGNVTRNEFDALNRPIATTDPLGGVSRTSYDALGRVLSTTDELGRITRQTYDALGRVTDVEDARGFHTQNTFDAVGNLLQTMDRRGNPTTFQYDVLNREITRTDAEGNVTRQTYDAVGNLVSVTDPRGNLTQAEYDARNRVVKDIDAEGGISLTTYDALGRTLTNTDPLERVTAFSYDALGNILLETAPGGFVTAHVYDANSNRIATTDPRGNVTRWEFDHLNRPTRLNDALNGEWRTEYDAVGNATRTIDALGRETVRTYDALRRNISTRDALGGVSSNEYDAVGQLLSHTDELGRVTRYTYDAAGNVLTTTDPRGTATATAGDFTIATEYDANSNPVRIVDARGNELRVEFDRVNRRTRQTDALGFATTTAYDANGNIVATTDARGATITTEFDRLNRPVRATDPLGGVTIYVYDAAGQLSSQSDPLGRVSSFTYDVRGNRLTATDPDGGVVTNAYDGNSNLTATTDARGNTTRYEFDALNRRTKLTDALNQATRTAYDAIGNAIRVTDALGRETNYTYDALDRLVSVRDALGGVSTNTYDAAGQLLSQSDELGRATAWTYDVVGNVLTSTDARGVATVAAGDFTVAREYDANSNLVRIVDARGNATRYAYDPLNRRTQVTDALNHVTTTAYDDLGNVVSVTNARGFTTTVEYDLLNRPTRTADALDGTTTQTYDAAGQLLSVTDSIGRTTTNTYDRRGNLLTITDPADGVTTNVYDANSNLTRTTDALGHAGSFQFDVLNRMTRATDPSGNFSTSTYDAVGNVILRTDRRGNSWQTTYDALNRPTKTVDPLSGESLTSYDAAGQVVSRTDEEGRVTRFTYDLVGNRIAAEDALGQVSRAEFDANSNRVRELDALNNETQFTFDALNRAVTTTDARGNTFEVTFDNVGNVTTSKNKRGYETRTEYDALNRATKVTDALGGERQRTYDAAGQQLTAVDELNRTTTFAYDALGNRTSVTDPLGNVTRYEFNTKSLPTQMTDPVGNVTRYEYDLLDRQVKVIDARNGETTYAYDANGNRTQLTDAEGNATTWEYDALNRPVRETNSLGDVRELAFDRVGNRIQKTDREGRVTRYAFDALNRLTEERWVGADGQAVVRTIAFEYDALGRVTRQSDPDSTYAFTYSPIGEVATVTHSGTTGMPETHLIFTYDQNSNRMTREERIGGQPGATTLYVHDALDRLTHFNQAGAGGNPVGGVGGGAAPEKGIALTYDAAGQWIGIARFSDNAETQLVATTTKTFDAAGRLTRIQHEKNGTPVNDFALTYDAASRITAHSSLDGTASFSYDATNQVTAADFSAQLDESYSYDLTGNRTNAGYRTGTNNQLQSDGRFDYEYDKEGNRISATEIATGRVTSYSYDHRNRLTGVVVGANLAANQQTVVDFAYDTRNWRIAKSVAANGQPAQVEHFAYDGDNLLLTFDDAGQLTRRVLTSNEVDQVFAEETATDVFWSLTDWQRSVRDVLDRDGDVVNHIAYSTFGQVTSETNSATDHLFGYTGREFDAETGLLYLRNRYYDPAAGRFASEDPTGFDGQDANLNAYVRNNPLNQTDSMGTEPDDKKNKNKAARDRQAREDLENLKRRYPTLKVTSSVRNGEIVFKISDKVSKGASNEAREREARETAAQMERENPGKVVTWSVRSGGTVFRAKDSTARENEANNAGTKGRNKNGAGPQVNLAEDVGVVWADQGNNSSLVRTESDSYKFRAEKVVDVYKEKMANEKAEEQYRNAKRLLSEQYKVARSMDLAGASEHVPTDLRAVLAVKTALNQKGLTDDEAYELMQQKPEMIQATAERLRALEKARDWQEVVDRMASAGEKLYGLRSESSDLARSAELLKSPELAARSVAARDAWYQTALDAGRFDDRDVDEVSRLAVDSHFAYEENILEKRAEMASDERWKTLTDPKTILTGLQIVSSLSSVIPGPHQPAAALAAASLSTVLVGWEAKDILNKPISKLHASDFLMLGLNAALTALDIKQFSDTLSAATDLARLTNLARTAGAKTETDLVAPGSKTSVIEPDQAAKWSAQDERLRDYADELTRATAGDVRELTYKEKAYWKAFNRYFDKVPPSATPDVPNAKSPKVDPTDPDVLTPLPAKNRDYKEQILFEGQLAGRLKIKPDASGRYDLVTRIGQDGSEGSKFIYDPSTGFTTDVPNSFEETLKILDNK